MVNKCEGCPRNCCLNFKITTELANPLALRDELEKFSFIKRTGSALVFGPGGNERVVGVYNCERFDPKEGKCRNYETKPRPSFCKNTGERNFPHPDCVLKFREAR